MTEAPAMRELLGEDTPTNWGKWGPDDEVGCLNYLDAGEVLRGIRHVRTGEVFTLQTPMGHPKGDPVFPGRESIDRENILDESSWGPGKEDAPDFPGGLHYARSEEHTSELQSRENLVCRLLLEKKNKKSETST